MIRGKLADSLRIEVRHDIPSDEELRVAWNSLVWAMDSPQVFYTYEWALAVERAYGEVLRPLLFLGYRDNVLVGVAALARGSGECQASFLCSTTADYCDFISAPQDRRDFVSGAFDLLHDMRVRTVTLANLPADSHSVTAVARAARKHGYGQFSRPAYHCAQVVLGEPGGQDEESVKKSSARRPPPKLSDAQVEHLTEFEDIQVGLPSFVEAHVVRFLTTGRISNLARRERFTFLRELANLLSRSGWLRFSRLSVAGRPIAWNYGFNFAGTWFWYQPTFDIDFQQCSPGFYLLRKIVEEARESADIRVVDLGLGAEAYKDRVANQLRQTLHITVSASALTLASTAVRYQTATAIQRKPELERAVRRVAGKVLRTYGLLKDRGIGSCTRRLLRTVSRLGAQAPEICFFQYTANHRPAPVTTSLRVMELRQLANAAMEYSHDEETLNYILRAAARIRSGETGFALLKGEVPVHFCWVCNFERFRIPELGCMLSAPCAGSVILLDCWTPRIARGKGHYRTAISRVAGTLLAEGRSVWISTAASDAATILAIEEAGFVKRFSLTRQHRLIATRIVRVDAPEVEANQSTAACAD